MIQCTLYQKFVVFKGSVFKGHTLNRDYGEDNHELTLIKLIGNLFLKIVGLEKTTSALLSKLGLRQKLTKLILFNNT